MQTQNFPIILKIFLDIASIHCFSAKKLFFPIFKILRVQSFVNDECLSIRITISQDHLY